MGNKNEGARPVYAIERLGLAEIGPMSMSNLLIDHLEATPKKENLIMLHFSSKGKRFKKVLDINVL